MKDADFPVDLTPFPAHAGAGSSSAEFIALQDIKAVVCTAKMIAESEGDLVRLAPYRRSDPRPALNHADMRKLLKAFRTDFAEVKGLFPGNKFNPYFTAFKDALEAHPELADLFYTWPKLVPEQHLILHNELSLFAKQVRAVCSTREFRRKLHAVLRGCRGNHQDALEFLRMIFATRGSRQLVMRHDYGYATGESFQTGMPISVSREQAMRDLEKLLRHLRAKFPLSGYIWRLEHGLIKGYHFHLLILMNGHLVQDDHRIAYLLQEKWNQITEGNGSFCNCNAKHYYHRGVGMIDYSDAAMLKALKEHALPYLTKVDLWTSHLVGRTFGKGGLPPVKKSSGRPRIN